MDGPIDICFVSSVFSVSEIRVRVSAVNKWA